MSLLVQKVNTYLSVLFITVFGSGAALLIIHIANVDTAKLIENQNLAEYQAIEVATHAARTHASGVTR